MNKSQPLLFGSDAYGTPIARTTDPSPSHEAAAKITASGQRDDHATIVLGVMQRNPDGLTYVELWRECTEGEKAILREPVEVMRRLNDLVKSGAATKGELRECSVKRVKMTTWIAK